MDQFKLLGDIMIIRNVFTTLAFSLLCGNSAVGQSVTFDDLFQSGEFDDQKGYVPTSLYSLVATSSIIVRGRFGEYLSTELNYGKGMTRELLIKTRGIPENEVDRYGVPVSKYEIIIEDVLMGEISDDKIVYSIIAFAPTDRKFTRPETERIFFLVSNEDGSYSPMSESSVLNLRGNQYTFDSLAPYSKGKENQQLEFLKGRDAKEFEAELSVVITNEVATRRK